MLFSGAVFPLARVGQPAFCASNNVSDSRSIHFIYEKNAASYGFSKSIEPENFEKVHYINGDISPVWYGELLSHFENSSILTAGLTRESESFVIKTLARDYAYEMVHEQAVDNTALVSWLLVPHEQRA